MRKSLGGFNSSLSFGEQISRDIRGRQREMDESMARSRREMDAHFNHSILGPSISASFGSSRRHSPLPPHAHHHQPNPAEIAEQRRHAEMEGERVRQEAERLRAEAAVNEERRRLERLKAEERYKEDAVRREEERARMVVAEEKRRLEREKQELIRAEHRRQEDAVRRAEEARLAEARKIQALKDAAEARIQEDQEEQNRLTVFDAHQNIITDASLLKFLELQQQLNALEPLINPIQRFQNTLKKGIPLAADGTTTLFLSILQNKNFGNESKYQLLKFLMDYKGYGPYLNILLSSPIIDLLIADSQPKVVVSNEQSVIILPDPFIILKEVFKKTVACKMQINEEVEKHIYTPLILAGYGMDIFDYHYEQKTPDKAMQFLLNWRSLVDLVNPANNFYLNLMRAHKNMSKDFYKLLKADFMQLYVNDYAAFISLVIAADMDKSRVANELQEWSLVVNGYDIIAFIDIYKQLITDPKKEMHVDLNANILKNILVLKLIANEVTVWDGLIKADKKCGLDIFKYLLENSASKTKLLQYLDVWMNALSNDEEIREIYHQVKALVKNSSLKDFRFPIRTIGEVNTEKLVVDSRNIINEDVTLKWFKYTRPGFFGISCSKARSGYDAYQALRENVQTGKALFEQDRDQAEEEINQQLIAVGEEGAFRFRR